MLNENAKKWVAALRSGEYEQTKGVLKRGDGYCCLGVGCDVYQREVGDLEVQVLEGSDGTLTWFDGTETVLPSKVQQWLGLRTSEGFHTDDDTTLTGLNDHYCWSFAQIADRIESEPPGLFADPPSEEGK